MVVVVRDRIGTPTSALLKPTKLRARSVALTLKYLHLEFCRNFHFSRPKLSRYGQNFHFKKKRTNGLKRNSEVVTNIRWRFRRTCIGSRNRWGS